MSLTAATARLRMPARAASVLLVAACALAGSSALAAGASPSRRTAASAAHVRHLANFLSPDRKVWCGGGGIGTDAMFCGTGGEQTSNPNPPQSSATMGSTGKITLCEVAASSFSAVCLQNWDATAPVLAYGQQSEVQNILCTSATSGITCVVASGPGKGRGFFINATTVRRVGPSGPAPPPVPVLGDSDAAAAGFGEPHPTLIAEGNNPLTELTHIHWRNWGASRATGTGTGFWLPDGKPLADARPAPAQIVAFDLGMCHGQRAYLKEEHWIPSHSGRFNPRDAYPTCL